jgi:hypothetical protein
MAAFPWHSILHRAITDALLDVIHDARPAMLEAVLLPPSTAQPSNNSGATSTVIAFILGQAAFPSSLDQAYDSSRPRPTHGYGPHLASLANALVELVAEQGAARAAAEVASPVETPDDGVDRLGETATRLSAAAEARLFGGSMAQWAAFVGRELAVYNVHVSVCGKLSGCGSLV